MDTFAMQAIGYVHSCFKEKFAIPRQPALAPAARGIIELVPPYNQAHALSGLEHVSHIWVIFVFHQALEQQHRLQVRPPRLGGNQRLGVFASRASHRPNSIGQSLVRLDGIDEQNRLHISGIDLLDGTPILDIKPLLRPLSSPCRMPWINCGHRQNLLQVDGSTPLECCTRACLAPWRTPGRTHRACLHQDPNLVSTPRTHTPLRRTTARY